MRQYSFILLVHTLLLFLLPLHAISQVGESMSLKQPKEYRLANTSKGIAYSGFRHGQHPDRGHGAVFPSDEQILEDLKILTEKEGFKLIRLYDSQKNSEDVLRLIKTHDIPLKVMLGIWLDGEISNHQGCEWITKEMSQDALLKNKEKNKEEITQGIRLANSYKNIVVAVNVGNEALVTWNDHLVPIDSLIAYIKEVKSKITQPVTTADNYKVFVQYGSKLADHLDFLAVHTYPQWEGRTLVQSLDFSTENLLEIRDVLPNKPIVISEAGWATAGIEFGERASIEKQTQHFDELMEFGEHNNISIIWFEAFDEDWKGNTNEPNGAEKHWGLYDINRKRKNHPKPPSK